MEPNSPISMAIADSLDYLAEHWQAQPTLDQLADRAGWSPSHYQRAFTQHVGVSPKRFLQFITLGHARDYLDSGASLLDTAIETGLSGPGRLHDLFIATEAMTPGEYKALGAGLEITYGWFQSPLGAILIGATEKGICWFAFADPDQPDSAERQFHEEWALASRTRDEAGIEPIAQNAMAWLMQGDKATTAPKLLLRGTNFQLKVWHALLRIPPGQVMSYGSLAKEIGDPKASRAVGSACGANLISWLIPCHRAVTATGMIHAYRWGVGRKRLLLAQEFAAQLPGGVPVDVPADVNGAAEPALSA